MRAFFFVVVLIALTAGAGPSRASAGPEAPSAQPAAATAISLGADDPARALAAGKPGLGFAPPFSLPKTRAGETRVAQLLPQVAAPEATSGNPSLAPLKWVGLLVMPNPTNPNGLFQCTAQFITPNVLLTAGHCLKDLESSPAGPWPDPTKGSFWLQYQNDAGTQFSIACGAVNPLFTLPPLYSLMTSDEQQAALITAFQHDFAMLLVNGTSPTGAMPYALDWKGQYDFATRVGYPGDILDAAIVQNAPGIVFPADSVPLGPWASPNLVVHWGPVTDATQGMSGGGWIANFSQTEAAGNNVLIAVTSFSPPAPPAYGGSLLFPGGTFAAYLTAAEFNPLLQYVENGCK